MEINQILMPVITRPTCFIDVFLSNCRRCFLSQHQCVYNVCFKRSCSQSILSFFRAGQVWDGQSCSQRLYIWRAILESLLGYVMCCTMQQKVQCWLFVSSLIHLPITLMFLCLTDWQSTYPSPSQFLTVSVSAFAQRAQAVKILLKR